MTLLVDLMAPADRDQVEQADTVARIAHHGQVDKAGKPYIEHPRAVAFTLVPFGVRLVCAGLLHDVIEDSPFTADDLIEAGVHPDVVALVVLVTKTGERTYAEEMRHIAASPHLLDPLRSSALRLRQRPVAAALLKLADNASNSLPGRLAALDPEVRERLGGSKYPRARRVLLPAVGVDAARIVYERGNPDLLAEIGTQVSR